MHKYLIVVPPNVRWYKTDWGPQDQKMKDKSEYEIVEICKDHSELRIKCDKNTFGWANSRANFGLHNIYIDPTDL